MQASSRFSKQQASNLFQAGVFEASLCEVVGRQNRCFHVVQLLLAISFFCLVLSCVAFLFTILWQYNPFPTLLSAKLITACLFVVFVVRAVRQKFALESDEAMSKRINRGLSTAGFDLAYDVYSCKLYSKESKREPSSRVAYNSTT